MDIKSIAPRGVHSIIAILAALLFTAISALVTKAEPPETVCTNVNSYSLRSPKIFWHDAANCIPASGEFPAINADQPEIISRVASSGGLTRELLNENPSRPPQICNTYHVFSDIVADNDYIYWVHDSGLVRLSTDANLGDPQELVSATITGGNESLRAELAIGNSTELFARTYNGSHSRFYIINKSTGVAQLRATITGLTTQLSFDGKYLYYLRSGILWRLSVTGVVSLKQIDTGVTGYHAEGRKNLFPFGSTEYVWFAKGRRIYRYDNVSNATSSALYTSTDPTAVVYSMSSIGGGGLIIIGAPSGVFFLERRTVQIGFFNYYNQLLFRIPRGGGSGELLYSRSGSAPVSIDADKITDDNYWLYWRDAGRVLRLSADADELEKTNMRITGMEVTQTIQNLANSVPLIEGKRTFVRMHVKSDDPSQSVQSVYANITATWLGGSGGPLNPINGGGKITVHPSPDRKDINQSFLFEIPHQWTSKSNLRIYGHLNPFHLPLQNSYANNESNVGPFTFLPSPRMELDLFAFRHEVSGTEYAPDYTVDVLPALSWMRRVYPLSSNAGGINIPGPGFRPRVTYVFDGGLGERVDQTHPDCQAQGSLCASNYVNAKMGAWRTENGAQPYFLYGMMDSAPSFTRGSSGGTGVASGPAGPPGGANWNSWDTDGTYGDFYMGHELGHVLGRAHPSPNSDDPATENVSEGCGHSRSDPSYPYANALIGPPGDSFMGFDAGWQNLPKAVYPSSQWADMMSYCRWQWISDYTYKGIYNRLQNLGFVSQAGAGGPAAGGAKGNDAGPWLNIWGSINPETGHVAVPYLRKVETVASRPPAGEGNYCVQLFDQGMRRLGELRFHPRDNADEGPSLPFGVVMPWVDGTAYVRIVMKATDEVLFEKMVSRNAPTVTDPRIPTAGKMPLVGFHNLNWGASDADGDPLTFDVLRSHDGGDTFLPFYWGIKGSDVMLNTDEISGGEVIFRVIASDEVLCRYVDTMPYSISLKSPVPRITSPPDGTTVEYGQLLTFTGEADDLQDGSVLPESLVWTGLGSEPLSGNVISVPELPVGANTIRLTATNSNGLSASTSITVFVTDELKNPGATLSVSPLQVGWEVRTGGQNPGPKTLNISNAGGGSINWTAEENSSWLSLSSTGGTAPSTLTLFANRNNLPPGQEYQTNVTITSSTNPPQSYIIPVTLAIDVSSFLGPIGPLSFHRDRDGDCLPDWWEAEYAGVRSEESDGRFDDDCDGIFDLLEYAFGTDPTVGNHLECTLEPTAGMLGGEDALLFSHARRINEPKLKYEVETSSDGINWNTGLGFVQELNAVPLNGDLEEVTVLVIPKAPTAEDPVPTTLARVRVTGVAP